MINTMGGGEPHMINPEEDIMGAEGVHLYSGKSEMKELKEKLEEQATALDKIDRFMYK